MQNLVGKHIKTIMIEKTKQFLQKLKDSGHNNEDYDYSKVDYIKEAYRVLKPYGRIFIVETASKWKGGEEELKSKIESSKNIDKFIYIDGEKI